MKRIYRAESLVDGQLLLDALADAGIPAEMFHQNAAGGLGDLPVTYPEIWVRRDADAARAEQVADRLHRADLPPGRRVCATCGEANPTSFEICWQCHAPLPAAD